MTKSQEQRMDEIFGEYINERNFYEESVSSAFRYGYKAAMKEAEALVEALEFECGNRCSDLNPCNAKEALKKFKGELDV